MTIQERLRRSNFIMLVVPVLIAGMLLLIGLGALLALLETIYLPRLGMTLQELQKVFVEQGCKVAYNLDGGGSATMVMGGERVNKTSGSRERNVSDIVYFTK